MIVRKFILAGLSGIFIATATLFAMADPPKNTAAPSVPREGFAPDPPLHAAEKQWVFEVRYDKGVRSVVSARSAMAKKPIATARSMGRFALEFRVGKELLDRIRFDVPLLGDDERERGAKGLRRPTFALVTTKLKVQMADHPRATTLTFVDRATATSQVYFWPPNEKGELVAFSSKSATGNDGKEGANSNAPSDSATKVGSPSGSSAQVSPNAPVNAPAGSNGPISPNGSGAPADPNAKTVSNAPPSGKPPANAKTNTQEPNGSNASPPEADKAGNAKVVGPTKGETRK